MGNVIVVNRGSETAAVTTCGPLTFVGNVVHSSASRLVQGAASIEEVNACEWSRCVEAGANRHADPGFVDAEAGDYHLARDSPCVGAGLDPRPYGMDVRWDWDGEPRPLGSGWDIGFDEVRVRIYY